MNDIVETGLSNKEQCKAVMKKLFGPNSAHAIDFFGEDECIEKCRDNVVEFGGPQKVKMFDKLFPK